MVVKIALNPFERELILEYGYPSGELRSQLKKLSNSERPESISFESVDLDMVTGDLSRSINHGEVPNMLLDEVDALCSRLEDNDPLYGRQERRDDITARKDDVVKEIVYETVARHLGLRRQELHETTSLDDTGTFYRIIVDIEQQLGLSPLEGDWCFDEGSIGGLVSYYSNMMKDRAHH